MAKRLLFVDDEPMILQGLRRSLHSMRNEWEMHFVDGGPQALELLGRESFDAVITDMRMPIMDGAQLLEEVKRRHPDVVRMVLSGQSSRDAILRSIAPAHQYMSKPCDPEELKLRLSQAFAMRDLLCSPKVKAIVSGMKTVPSLPALYEELLVQLRSEQASLNQIGQIIAKDGGMTAKILQLANSAFIGLRGHVSNPTNAISLIGLEMVRTLVLSVHVFSQFERTDVASYLPELWQHSVKVATLAQRIATSEGSPKALREECFTAGLLHDVGKIVLLSEMAPEYKKILARESPEPGSFLDAELEFLGCTHAQVGAYLMGIWGLPLPLVRAVAFHHQPMEGGEKTFTSLTAVHGADAIAGAAEPSPLNCDVTLDDTYIAELALGEKQELWRGFHQEYLARHAAEALP